MIVTNRLLNCLCAASLVVLLGCGPDLQPAGGKVLVDGKPVNDGTVMFYPTKGGRAATATIAGDGSFTLSFERPGDGLPVGEYKVVITADVWTQSKTKTPQQLIEEAQMKKQGIEDPDSVMAGGVLTHIVPPEYNDIKTTPLTQTVASSSEPQSFVFDIATKKKK